MNPTLPTITLLHNLYLGEMRVSVQKIWALDCPICEMRAHFPHLASAIKNKPVKAMAEIIVLIGNILFISE